LLSFDLQYDLICVFLCSPFSYLPSSALFFPASAEKIRGHFYHATGSHGGIWLAGLDRARLAQIDGDIQYNFYSTFQDDTMIYY